MIRQTIRLQRYDWTIHCYFAVDCYYTEEIARRLEDIGCEGDDLFRAVTNMDSCKLDQGLCYSNTTLGESVLVVGLTSSAAEFLNSFTHELHHLVTHICDAREVDYRSEEAAYLCGDLAEEMSPAVEKLLRNGSF